MSAESDIAYGDLTHDEKLKRLEALGTEEAEGYAEMVTMQRLAEQQPETDGWEIPPELQELDDEMGLPEDDEGLTWE